MSEESPIILVDVRTPEEYKTGHIPDAINIDFYSPDFVQQIKPLLEEGEVILYCRSGRRSGEAVTTLETAGYVVQGLPGGITAYQGELVGAEVVVLDTSGNSANSSSDL